MTIRYRFAAIPEWVLYHPDLTGEDIRVFGVLARHGGDVRPALQTVAERTGKSVDTVRRSIRALASAAALFVEERFDEHGRQTANRYHLAGDEAISGPNPAEPEADAPTPPRTDATDEGSTDATLLPGMDATRTRARRNESKRNETTTPTSPRPGGRREVVDEEFEHWWSLYPKKASGKGQARERWRKMTAVERTAAADTIQVHVAWWISHGTDAQFIPAGSTWLNQRRWEDEEPRNTVVREVGKLDWRERSRLRRARAEGASA